mmetsp:Transcript_21956/g.38604  ORF Transcript_21956/g.38604 Transcript_21956/m.38604 type:complete len:233 (+) Transcript_21956:78-776(+)
MAAVLPVKYVAATPVVAQYPQARSPMLARSARSPMQIRTRYAVTSPRARMLQLGKPVLSEMPSQRAPASRYPVKQPVTRMVSAPCTPPSTRSLRVATSNSPMKRMPKSPIKTSALSPKSQNLDAAKEKTLLGEKTPESDTTSEPMNVTLTDISSMADTSSSAPGSGIIEIMPALLEESTTDLKTMLPKETGNEAASKTDLSAAGIGIEPSDWDAFAADTKEKPRDTCFFHCF